MKNEPNISLYNEDAGEDFPVLKAFQQYIDAEQTKARQRLLTVSLIFSGVLIAVIIIFSVMVMSANNRTQNLYDRMLELAMVKNVRQQQPEPTVTEPESSENDATANELREALATLQQRLDEQERRTKAEDTRKSAAATAKVQTDKYVSDSEKRAKATEARIQKQLALLNAERQKLADEKKKQHEEELERYRREHYPEYYAKLEAAKKAKEETVKEVKNSADMTPEEIDAELAKEVSYSDLENDRPEPDDLVPPAIRTMKKLNPEELDLDKGEAIDYFKSEDTYTIPVEVDGKKTEWHIPRD